MTDKEITEDAITVLIDYLDSGIDYCKVYEHEDLQGAEVEDLVKIHGKANKILSNLAEALENDNLPASLYL